jgi:hypothetical protein
MMRDDSTANRTGEVLLNILLNKDVVRDGEYQCTLNSDPEHCTVRFTPTSSDNEEQKDGEKEKE